MGIAGNINGQITKGQMSGARIFMRYIGGVWAEDFWSMESYLTY